MLSNLRTWAATHGHTSVGEVTDCITFVRFKKGLLFLDHREPDRSGTLTLAELGTIYKHLTSTVGTHDAKQLALMTCLQMIGVQRPSEMVGIQLRDVLLCDKGADILIRELKNYRFDHRRHTIYMAKNKPTEFLDVPGQIVSYLFATNLWLEHSNIKPADTAPLFRVLDKKGHATSKPITYEQYATRLGKALIATGLDTRDGLKVTPQGLRASGMMAIAGTDDPMALMAAIAQGGWKIAVLDCVRETAHTSQVPSHSGPATAGVINL